MAGDVQLHASSQAIFPEDGLWYDCVRISGVDYDVLLLCAFLSCFGVGAGLVVQVYVSTFYRSAMVQAGCKL